jgi:hypothetical protein
VRFFFNGALILFASVLLGFILVKALRIVAIGPPSSFWILTILVFLLAAPAFYMSVSRTLLPMAGRLAQWSIGIGLGAATAYLTPYVMWMTTALLWGE